MTAWINFTDPLLVSTDQSQAAVGSNWIANRTLWFDLSNVTLGGPSGSQWWRDAGPKGMASNLLEARAFCLKGTVTFPFVGTTLIIRINVAFSWFTGATITIDGQAPSTMGLLTARDTLSCDAATYLLTNDAYIDVIVADGLTLSQHTCVITINSTDPSKFFSIAGFKVGMFESQTLYRRGTWLVPIAYHLAQNLVTLTLTNRSNASVLNVSLSFPTGLVSNTGAALSPLTSATMAPNVTLTQALMPVFTGDEFSDIYPYSLTLSAEYPDPDGTNTHTVGITALVGSDALSVSGTWFQDTLTPTGQTRLYTSTYGATITLTFTGDALTLTVQQALSWGVIGIYASNNTTLLASVTCNVDSTALGVHVLTGFGSGDHTVILRKTVNDSAFIVFVSAAWSVTQHYTQIIETVTLAFNAQQPYALLAQSVVAAPNTKGNFTVSWDAPVQNARDYSGVPVYENTHLLYTEVLTRFPTFAVFYQAGQTDLLAGYDILIVDPFAVHAADVATWQAKGIEVYGYISSGEEFGFYSNRYDFGSALAPNSGAGPGGYAAYYMYTKHPVSGPPDQDGVWAAYYTNPDPAYGWPDRINNYYAPLVLGAPLVVTNEVVTTKTVSITAGSRIVFDTAHAPLDEDQPITLTTMDGAHSYLIYRDFTFDTKTGAIVLAASVSPAVISGQQLKVSYTRKGLSLPGVFFDTVDTPDVYAGPDFGYQYVAGYADKFAAMINNFKAAHPTAKIISNRGFTILPQIIASCSGVMFESWLTLPTDINNLATTDYAIITDPDTVAANAAINDMMQSLRVNYVFDVYSLNYCHPDSRGDELRAYCRAQDAAHGYLSWQAVITLDDPQPNTISSQIPGLPSSDLSPQFTRMMMRAIT